MKMSCLKEKRSEHYYADSEGSKQPAQLCRLIKACAVSLQDQWKSAKVSRGPSVVFGMHGPWFPKMRIIRYYTSCIKRKGAFEQAQNVIQIIVQYYPGPSCSKLTMSLLTIL